MILRAHAVRAILAIAFSIAVASCAGSPETVDSRGGAYTGSDGVVSDVSDTTRIITLSGDLTEIIFALDAGSSIVATDLTTVYPNDAVTLPKIGVGRFLSAEAVLAQDPTLVIGDTQSGPQAAIEQIRAAGVPVVIFDVSTTFATMYDKIADLGVILGSAELAVEMTDQLRADIESATAGKIEPDDAPSVAYVYTRGPDVLLLFGSDMVTEPIIEATGATDAGAAAGIEGNITVTAEALIAAAPDVIVVPSEGLAALGGLDGLLAIPGIAETPAGLNRRVLDYPEGDFLTLGPRIASTLAALARDLAAMTIAP